MGKWTRRDLVKAGLAASAGVMTGSELTRSREPAAAATDACARRRAAAGWNAPNSLRERLSLDYGWRFALGNANDPDKDFGFGKLRGEGRLPRPASADGPAAPRFNDPAWRKIDLPHDWAIDLPFVNNPVPDWARGQAAGAGVSGDQRWLVPARVCAAGERCGAADLRGV